MVIVLSNHLILFFSFLVLFENESYKGEGEKVVHGVIGWENKQILFNKESDRFVSKYPFLIQGISRGFVAGKSLGQGQFWAFTRHKEWLA